MNECLNDFPAEVARSSRRERPTWVWLSQRLPPTLPQAHLPSPLWGAFPVCAIVFSFPASEGLVATCCLQPHPRWAGHDSRTYILSKQGQHPPLTRSPLKSPPPHPMPFANGSQARGMQQLPKPGEAPRRRQLAVVTAEAKALRETVTQRLRSAL